MSARPSPCAVPPSIWPSTACRFSAFPTSCAVPIQTTRVRPRSTSTSTTTRIAATANATCARSPSAWPGLAVERVRAWMPVDALDVDLAPRALALLERGAAGDPRRAGGHPRHARSRGRAGGADVGGRAGDERDVLDAELEPGDLEDHVVDALADLRRRAVDLRPIAVEQPDARGAIVVEALRVAEVLEADREPDTAPDALAAGGVPRAAG